MNMDAGFEVKSRGDDKMDDYKLTEGEKIEHDRKTFQDVMAEGLSDTFIDAIDQYEDEQMKAKVELEKQSDDNRR
jgi:hypothetical protein